MIRWACRLEEFDYEIEYQPGKFNKSADALSRLSDKNKIMDADDSQRKYPGIEVNYNLEQLELNESNVLEQFHLEGINLHEFKNIQQTDVFIQNFIRKNNNNQFIRNDVIIKDQLIYKTNYYEKTI